MSGDLEPDPVARTRPWEPGSIERDLAHVPVALPQALVRVDGQGVNPEHKEGDVQGHGRDYRSVRGGSMVGGRCPGRVGLTTALPCSGMDG